jgi:hypothetical protein
LVIVALLGRLHPRHWDGQRLLRFLTGLALLALAFAAPAAPAEAAVTPAPAVEVSVAAVAAPAPVSAPEPASIRDASPSETCWHDASGYTTVARPAGDTVALAGADQRVHGSRAPPRA